MGHPPRNEQVYLLLKQRISDGVYPPGFRLPPEIELANELTVSRNTLRWALQKLEDECLITRIRSKGTFVMPYYDNADTLQRVMVLCQLDSSYYYPCHYILPGMVREAAVRGIELEICELTFFEKFTPERLQAYLESARICGIIVIASNYSDGNWLLKLLNTQSIPVLQVHGKPDDYTVTNWGLLYCRTREWWSEALRYLAACGHKNVVTTAFVSAENEIRYWKFDEYTALLKTLGLNPCEKLIVNFSPYDHAALKEQLTDLFRNTRPRPTAVMAFSDHQAPVIYEVLNSLNLRIPEDVAVMGFCGVPNCEYMTPPLSTVDMKYQLMGAKAIAIIASADEWYTAGDNIKKRPLVEHPLTLTVRESTSLKVKSRG